MDQSHIYSQDSLLVTDNEVFSIEIYNENAKEYFKGVAYLDGPYFYIYRGELDQNGPYNPDFSKFVEPGLYIDSNTKKSFLVPPITEEDKEYYTYENKISSYDPKKLIEAINRKEQIINPVLESSKIFMPEISKEDDILKRLIKTAIINKNIDLDSYKHRFIDKNALFNFKQCLRSTNTKLSILLFDRGIEALNLKYTIIIEEADPKVVVGDILKEPIRISSEDTYEI